MIRSERHWRHALRERLRLIHKLSWLERRLARQRREAIRRHLPAHIYAIDGTWFRQAGRRRPAELRRP